MYKLVIVSLFAVVVTGCDGGFCNDSEGLGPGLIKLTKVGYELPTRYSSFGSTLGKVYPYEEGSPSLKCRTLGVLQVLHRDAIVDSDHYPSMEYFGGIGLEAEDGVDVLDGFDSVIELGGIGNEFGENVSVSDIRGFNNVETVTGSIATNGIITGLNKLIDLGGSISVGATPGLVLLERIGGSFDAATTELPSLIEIGGDLVMERMQQPELGFPNLARIGGNVTVYGNSSLQSWLGFSPGATIGGDFSASSNQPILDETFQA